MKAVIFCAGLGTRLRPLTDETPKSLIEIGGAAVLERTLRALPKKVDEAIVVVGHLGKMIRERFGARKGMRFVEQPILRGTYDALLCARNALNGGPFLAMNGDDLYGADDLARLAKAVPYALLAKSVPRPNRYSHVESSDGRLTRIVPNRELPDASILNETRVYTGACLLDRTFFDLEPAPIPSTHAVPGAGTEFSLPHTLEKHLNKRPVRVVDGSFWLPVGTPKELETARAALVSG
jgi:NDP-sugar pyrophosphorylase family protein